MTRHGNDAAVVYPDGADPYAPLVPTRGVGDAEGGSRLVVRLSRIVSGRHPVGARANLF